MTDDQLRRLAIESGAALWGTIDCGQIAFTTPESLQAFALRIEAQAIKFAQFGKALSDKESLTIAFSGIEVTLKRYT